VARVAGYADGLNIKLAKSGGISEALRMIHAARALGLQVMLGCMIESELGIGCAAAQIASLVGLRGSRRPSPHFQFAVHRTRVRDGGVVASGGSRARRAAGVTG